MADKKKDPPRAPDTGPGWINRLPEGAVGTHADPVKRSKAVDYWGPKGMDEFMKGPSQWDYLQNRDEPERPDEYSRGGRVKHGSSTIVTCRNKT